MKAADRFADVQLSLIRQINALATPLSVNLGISAVMIIRSKRITPALRRQPAPCVMCRAELFSQ